MGMGWGLQQGGRRWQGKDQEMAARAAGLPARRGGMAQQYGMALWMNTGWPGGSGIPGGWPGGSGIRMAADDAAGDGRGCN